MSLTILCCIFCYVLYLMVNEEAACCPQSGSDLAPLAIAREHFILLVTLIMSSFCLRSGRQLSSSYLPVARPPSPPASSRESSRDDTSRLSKDSKSRQSDNPKRRSTMNSRDAAYDEEEQLRRAIEESKEDTRSAADEVASRRGKRSRSDSEA